MWAGASGYLGISPLISSGEIRENLSEVIEILGTFLFTRSLKVSRPVLKEVSKFSKKLSTHLTAVSPSAGL